MKTFDLIFLKNPLNTSKKIKGTTFPGNRGIILF